MNRPEGISPEYRLMATDLILGGPVSGDLDDVVEFETAIALAIQSAVEAERARAAAIVEGYPPEGFNEALWDRTTRYEETDPFWKFEGDTGNWAALMSKVLVPYADLIRKGA